MGGFDGLLVGEEEGFTDGLDEGDIVGFPDGEEEGRADGLADGVDVGLAEGEEDGRADGLPDGVDVGLADGEEDGDAVSSTIAKTGCKVLPTGDAVEGCDEGTLEGDTVGLFVGHGIHF
jgi:hypothetical protein